MNQELRERLGKAAHDAKVRHINESGKPGSWTWEETTNEMYKEMYRVEGEAAVLSFVELFLPVIRNMLSEDEIKRLLELLPKEKE